MKRSAEPAKARTVRRRKAAGAIGVAVLLALLASCAGEFDTVGEALRLLQPSLPNAVIGEPYEQQLHATGGLRPYTFEQDGGALPPGITLQNGALRGTPTQLGSFEFSIAVSDGNLNKTVQDFNLSVTDVPPPTFTLSTPLTEVREAVTLRVRVSGARELTAARVLVTWDPAKFTLRPGSVVAPGRDLAVLTQEAEGSLQVDLAVLGRSLNGEHTLYSFVLEPLEPPNNLWLEARAEFISQGADPNKRHHFTRISEGSRSPTPAGGEAQQSGRAGEESDPEAPDGDTGQGEAGP
ncbi:MAG: putative Ig domain-containing protein [Trueperaceae bacterium]